MSDPNKNPFAALLEPGPISTRNIASSSTSSTSVLNNSTNSQTELNENKSNSNMKKARNATLTRIIEDVFAITVDCNKYINMTDSKSQVVFLEELAASLHPQTQLDMETLELALFERLLIPDVIKMVLPKNSKYLQDHVIETKAIVYLFNAYCRLKLYLSSEDSYVAEHSKQIKKLILRNVVTAMLQPDLFEEQVLWEQWLQVIRNEANVHNMDAATDFLNIVLEDVIKEDEGAAAVKLHFVPILAHIHNTVSHFSLLTIENWTFSAIELFASNIHLADVLLNYCTPEIATFGRVYGDSLFGAFLSLSILPKIPGAKYMYPATDPMEETLWRALEHVSSSMHGIFIKVLRHGQHLRQKMLQWIANCLHNNANRGRLWTAQIMAVNRGATDCVSDAFILNLGAVLLRMCQPFCNDTKILKVDPTYCAVEDADCVSKDIHMKCLSAETCLLPSLEGVKRPTAMQFNFPTECFMMTQKCLDLGYRVCVDRLTGLNQELAQLQRTFFEAREQASPSAEALKENLNQNMTKYMSLRNTLFEPSMLQNLVQFHISTAVWITQVAVNLKTNRLTGNVKTYAPTEYQEVNFPLSEEVPETLRCIPEYVIENTIGFATMVRHFNTPASFQQPVEFLSPILTLILVFMGANNRMSNPHLRAKLAESLETLLPTWKQENGNTMNEINVFYRERLFKEHPHRLFIIPSLLNVFVGIEMTGQSVQFEQKFNYRRPMYIVMDYLWKIKEHRNIFKRLAAEAEKNMEAVTPPLFLRFVNLLLNDAVFLLDESLSNMAQLRTMQAARDNGDWNTLPAREREHNIATMHHIGQMARFDNILGRETIHTIQLITSEIRGVFTHSSMVDRVASMLNYFLLILVGPNKKNFKVKDSQQEYEFDPANTVLNICRIYINLSGSEAFNLAVSQDGRSYSSHLFTQAEDVLARIGGGHLIGDLRMVSERVVTLAERQQKEEEALTEAPDEFLDPIMSTLMLDPVILPSSRTTVDRTTIARHLLSDQSDPFNRSPLSMDQVKSDVVLKKKIEDWAKNCRAKAASASSSKE